MGTVDVVTSNTVSPWTQGGQGKQSNVSQSLGAPQQHKATALSAGKMLQLEREKRLFSVRMLNTQ